MNLNSLKELINSKDKTLIICPFKYRNLLYQKLLDNNQVLFNVSIMDINSFLNNVLSDNNISFDDDSTIISQLKIHQKLKADNHSLKDNINYLYELEKLQQEFNLSNVSYHDNIGNYINTYEFDFNNLTISYDKIIIFSDDDFYPIHHDFINSINQDIVYFKQNIKPEYQLFEHNNTIKMLDYVIFNVYNTLDTDTLILCDDPFQKEYLTNKFNELGIAYNTDLKQHDTIINQLTSLFSIIDNDYTEYDEINIKRITSFIKLEEIKNFSKLEYSEYLKVIYDILYQLNTFNTSYLNKIFTELYQFTEIKISLFNKLLLNELTKQSMKKDSYKKAKLFIMNTDFTGFQFEKVYLVDASLAQFNAKQTSYLLTTNQRQQISSKLITNQYYSLAFKDKQNKLLHCSQEIIIHYSLLNLDNKSQNLAHFITENIRNLKLDTKEDFYHLSTHLQLNDSLLIGNRTAPISKDNILDKFIDKLTISASALDSFGRCPYQYFIAYILKPFQKQELDSLTLGNLYHSIIEEINKLLVTSKEKYSTINNDSLTILIKDTIEVNVKKLMTDKLLPEYYEIEFTKQVFQTIQNFINSNIYLEDFSEYQVSASEQSLSTGFEHPVFNTVNIYGKIDAIMSYHDYHYVLDYKSSSKDFSETNFIDGIANQLITYLYLLKKNNYNITGAFFKTIKDNYIKTDNILDYDYNRQLHIDKNKMHGLLIENSYLDAFDSTLISDNKSTISNVTIKKMLNLEKLNEYFTILEQHFTSFVTYLENGDFKITPFMKTNCEQCQYKVICKADNPTFRKEERE